MAATIQEDSEESVRPVFMTLRSLGGESQGLQEGVTGGSGLNNIGMLVRVFGRVTDRDASADSPWFELDDGSGVSVKVIVPPGESVPEIGTCLDVTSISSCVRVSGELRRLLRMRSTSL
jgi:hypothetical protein